MDPACSSLGLSRGGSGTCEEGRGPPKLRLYLLIKLNFMERLRRLLCFFYKYYLQVNPKGFQARRFGPSPWGLEITTGIMDLCVWQISEMNRCPWRIAISRIPAACCRRWEREAIAELSLGDLLSRLTTRVTGIFSFYFIKKYYNVYVCLRNGAMIGIYGA